VCVYEEGSVGSFPIFRMDTTRACFDVGGWVVLPAGDRVKLFREKSCRALRYLLQGLVYNAVRAQNVVNPESLVAI
jgi:hypothetical protein